MQSILLTALILSATISSSQSLKKAFNAINSGKYDVASTQLYQILKKEPDNPAAEFLLAQMYDARDFPKRNLDSANKYIMKSAEGLKKEYTEKDLEKLQSTSGWREFTVNELQQQINDEAFRYADSIDEIETWNHFLTTYTTSLKITAGVEKRNAIAFEQATKQNRSEALKDFIATYPDALQVPAAKSHYETLLYKEETADSSWQSYKNFMDDYPNSPYSGTAKKNYDRLLYLDFTKLHTAEVYASFIQQHPESPYRTAAEDSVYTLYTHDDQLSSYAGFIKNFPSDRHVSLAWERIYEKETPLFTVETFRKFLAKYPDFPDATRVQRDMKLVSRQFQPIEKNGLYGFLDLQSRDTVIRPQFTELSPVYNGVAAAQLPCASATCPYCYVCVDGTIITRYAWSEANDFTDGHALAAVGNCEKDSCKYGFINRFGDWIVKPLYQDAFEYNEGLSLVKRNDLYGFINTAGDEVIPVKFMDAGSFSEGLASAQSPDSKLYGFIDHHGNFVIPPQFKKAGTFSETLAPVTDDRGLWGYIDHTGKWVIQPQYDYALSFVEGNAKVMMKVKDPKDPKLITLQDKTIDKKGK
ncbi:MAG: WG repeat-containing protein, partial [Chitinophagales bacterium]